MGLGRKKDTGSSLEQVNVCGGGDKTKGRTHEAISEHTN